MRRKYEILISLDLTTLDNKVNEMIEKGYIPQGGLCCWVSDDTEWYAQAVILKDETTHPKPPL